MHLIQHSGHPTWRALYVEKVGEHAGRHQQFLVFASQMFSILVDFMRTLAPRRATAFSHLSLISKAIISN